MKLKRLSLHGFKSFADRTDFDFADGLTGIIGPNGCGKSNVVDAVKWVLGDQRPTSQRGKEMLDVVFHGCEGRPGMGHAEVLLVLERDRKELGEEVDGPPVEMTIGRRLFRSGESEYLLNGQPVRLKDIKEALMDTGLGVGGYSVMEQGRIDAVLSANPEERRSIFDEAAGISRYKLRRKEALRKLDKTEQNLERVKDLRQEKASRVRSLKIQATRARSYRETEQRLMSLEVAVAILDSITLRCELDEVDADLERTEEQLQQLESERETARRELFEVEDETRALASRHGEIRDLANELRAEERSRREALESADDRIKSLGEVAARSQEEAERVRETLARTTTELEELVRQETELDRCLESATAELPEIASAAQQARVRFRDAQKGREQVRNDLLEAIHERTRAKNRIRDEELQGQALAARQQRLVEQITEVERRLEASAREGTRDVRVFDDLTARLARLRGKIEDYERRMSDAERARDATVKQLHELASERSAVRSQLALLEDLEASHTGLDDAARELLVAGGGVVGRLIDSIECPLEVGPAVEAVLGTRVQALVVEDFDVARRALDALAERKGGGKLALVDAARVPDAADAADTFVATADPAALPEDGLPLARFCRVDPAVRGLLGPMLDSVTLVRDLACAERLRGNGRVLVTLRGELVDAAWVAGGACEAAAGLLQRKASLEKLREELTLLGSRVTQAEAERTELDGTLERRSRLHERLEKLAESTQRKQAAIEHQLQARRARESELRLEIEQDRSELGELAGEKLQCTARMMTPMLEAMLLARRESGLEDTQRNLNEEVVAQDRLVHETQDRLSELQSRKAGLEAELAGLRERHALLERTLDDLRARAQALDEQKQGARREGDELVQDRERWKGELADYGCRAKFVEELSATVAENLKQLEDGTSAQRAAAERADEELLGARERRSERLIRSKETGLRLGRIDDEIWERYRIELARVRGEIEGDGLWVPGPVLGPPLPGFGAVRERVLDGSLRGPLLPPDYYDRERGLPRYWEDEEFDQDGAAREIEVLRARMQRMGSVNLGAEAELAKAQGHYEQLERDCVDLEEARKQLIETLHRINIESRALFERTFEAARTNFQEIFRKLFQGGRADIQLVETEDPLDSGIEIFARPPGKELRSIRLLSGGERSLTALAILFAVFQIKPSPFCILDEVDAALDEANVERFLRVLREFVGETQFLVVTHHKRTMADCKVLYGVTMPRKGISSRMSVSLEEVKSGEVDRVIEPKGRLPRLRGEIEGRVTETAPK